MPLAQLFVNSASTTLDGGFIGTGHRSDQTTLDDGGFGMGSGGRSGMTVQDEERGVGLKGGGG